MFHRGSFLVMGFLALLLIALAQTGVPAQSPVSSSEPLLTTFKSAYDGVKQNVIESAEVMPEEHYAFRPTPEIRTYGETLGHIANAHYSLCAGVKGEKSPNSANLEKLASKAAFVKALKDSYAYCDGAFDGLTDAKGMELIKVGGIEVPRVRNLIRVIAHDDHEYGKLVIYLRLKGQVPPSTARRGPS